MPGRKYAAGNLYRYGFNGKENDNQVKGEGNQQDYGMRIYDPRLGKFLSVDPISKSYPMLTPYQFASNRPVDGIDRDGLEYLRYGTSMYRLHVNPSEVNVLTGEYPNAKFQTTVILVTTVVIVYDNIPRPLQDPDNYTFKFVSGGPVGTTGSDLEPPPNGWILETGKYYQNPGEFYGSDACDNSPEPTSSTKGMGGKAINETRANATEAAAGAIGQDGLGGVAKNTMNSTYWQAMADEQNLRSNFYDATKIVDYNNKRLGFGGVELNPSLRANVINFITDGYLQLEQLGQLNISNTQRLSILTDALYIANIGVQTLGQLGKLQPATIEKVNELLSIYKNLGGNEKSYDSMKEYLTPTKQ